VENKARTITLQSLELSITINCITTVIPISVLLENTRANKDCEDFRKQLKTYFFTLTFNDH